MKRLLLLLISLLFIVLQNMAQDIRNSVQKIETQLVFELTAKEARQITLAGMKTVDSTFFHTCVDTLLPNQRYVENGNYLITSLEGYELNVEWIQNIPFSYQFLNNSTDFNLLLSDNNGNFIRNAKVFLNNKEVYFQEITSVYQKKKQINKGLLEIIYDGKSYFLGTKATYPDFRKRLKNKILFTFPLKYISRPIRNLKYAIKYHRKPTLFYSIQNFFKDPAYFFENKENRHFEAIRNNSTVIFDKPKYLPRDTVHYKIIVRNTKGRPYKNVALVLKLYSGANKNLGTVKPYKKGFYEGYFILTDSLNLRLDQYYSVDFENNKGYTLVSENFKYADYELNSEVFSFESDKAAYFKNDPIRFTISGFDDLHLALSDTKFEFSLQPQQIYDFKDKQLVVPKNYWTQKGVIPASGTITLTLPDSLRPNFSGHLKAIVVFQTADNKLVMKNTDFDYYDKLAITHGKITEENVIQPFEVVSSRTKDSVFIFVNNPGHRPYWYTLYFKNRKLEELQDSVSKQIRISAKPKRNYSISYHYLENGNVRSDKQVIPYQNKNLSIEFNGPMVVSPGQEVNLNIKVRNVNGKTQPNTDITAWAITNKFTENTLPNLLDYSKTYRQRKIYNDFQFMDSQKSVTNLPINLKFWKPIYSLDSSLFYQFLFPENQIFKATIPTKKRTEFAPFIIEKGTYKEIKYILLDKIPIYFQLSAEAQRYSFSVEKGKHHLTIRTADKFIEVNDVEFEENKKTIISIDPLFANPKVTVKLVGEIANSKEIYMLNQLLLPLNSVNHLPTNSYITQKKRVFYIEKNKSNFMYLGPISPGEVELNSPQKESVLFDYESGYNYEIKRNVVKMKEHSVVATRSFEDKSIRLSPYEESVRFQPDLGEVSWTKEEIEWKNKVEQEKKIEPEASYKVPNKSSSTNTELELKYQFKKADNFLKHIVLFKNNDPNFIRIYPPNVEKLYDLEPTYYTLYLLWNENNYSKVSVNKLHIASLNLIHINDDEIQKQNQQSKKIDSLVQKSVYGNILRPLEQINEAYRTENETFYIDWTTNDHYITGYVYDLAKEPLFGVTVKIKGKDKGTLTDERGHYQLYCPKNAVLVFSFIGYNSSEKLTNGINRLDVCLEEDNQVLEEVVITGYGVEVKKEMTGSLAVLQGKAAGVAIRGAASVTSPTNQTQLPVFVLNGKIIGKDDFDENTMEITEVLKGQTAIALYGLEARNGAYILSLKSNNLLSSTFRKNFRDVAFWQSKLTTNTKGNVNFTVKFPDDLTTWRTTIVAASSKKHSGVFQTEIKAFRSISANLSVPRFLVAGDSCQVYGKAKNYRQDSLKIELRFEQNDSLLRSNTISFIDSKTDSVYIFAPSSDSLSVLFGLKTKQNIEDAELRKIPVLNKGVTEVNGVFEMLEKDSVLSYDSENDIIVISLVANPIEVVQNEIRHLHDYSYLCNEQLASKLKAYLVAYKLAKKQNQPFEYDKDVKQVIKKLLANQNNNYEWGWWNVSNTQNWITSHVIESLFLAKSMGFSVDYDFNGFVQKQIYTINNKSVGEKLCTLRLINRLDTLVNIQSFIPRFDSLKTLSQKLDWYMFQQQRDTKVALDSLQKYEHKTILGGIYYGNRTTKVYENEVINTLKAYLIYKNRGGYEEKLNRIKQFFYESRNNGYWRNTYESASIIEAITPDLMQETSIINIPKVRVFSATISEEIDHFPFQKEYTNAHNLKLVNTARIPVFASVFEKSHTENPEKMDKGFDVKTYFVGTNSNQLKTGEKVTLRIEIEVKNDADYVMLEVPIPAGCRYENEASNYWWKDYYTEQYKDKKNFYFTTLKEGKYSFDISLISSFSGKYTLNPAKIELMYFPTFFGREAIKTVRIHPNAIIK